MEKILPNHLYEIICNHFDESNIYEIRLRVNRPIMINYLGKYSYLSKEGITNNFNDYIFCSIDDINYVMSFATNRSMYALIKQIQNGYITIHGGIRIGLCGEIVYDNDKVKTIKNIGSLNIRFPHQIKGCCDKIYPYLFKNDIYNTLIVSSPGMGKTTILRDLSYKFGSIFNVLLVDERNEIAYMQDCKPTFDIGQFTDVINNCDKNYAFSYGIRSMKPDIIITDELGENDFQCIMNAITCGVKVIATIHGGSLEDLLKKNIINKMIEYKYFSRYVILSNENVGECDFIYDENLKCIYCGET